MREQALRAHQGPPAKRQGAQEGAAQREEEDQNPDLERPSAVLAKRVQLHQQSRRLEAERQVRLRSSGEAPEAAGRASDRRRSAAEQKPELGDTHPAAGSLAAVVRSQEELAGTLGALGLACRAYQAARRNRRPPAVPPNLPMALGAVGAEEQPVAGLALQAAPAQPAPWQPTEKAGSHRLLRQQKRRQALRQNHLHLVEPGTHLPLVARRRQPLDREQEAARMPRVVVVARAQQALGQRQASRCRTCCKTDPSLAASIRSWGRASSRTSEGIGTGVG